MYLIQDDLRFKHWELVMMDLVNYADDASMVFLWQNTNNVQAAELVRWFYDQDLEFRLACQSLGKLAGYDAMADYMAARRRSG